MTCSHCGRGTGDARPPCPHCADYTLPATRADADAHADARAEAVDPEVLQPGQDDCDDAHSDAGRDNMTVFTSQGGGGGYRYFSWRHDGNGWSGGEWGMAASNASCLPMMITLGLLVGCAVQLGLLAAIGFGFFYLLGSVASTAVKARRILQGQSITPALIWSNRILVWGAALFITVVLAGKL